MSCRVGITTNPYRRKQEWENKCSCFKNWEILASGLSRKQAQEMEDKYSDMCDTHPGGREPENYSNNWSVYKFNHCGCRD